jgi:6 kDa early secretory antigenic target
MSTDSVIKYDFGAIAAAEKDIATSGKRLSQIQSEVQALMDELKLIWTGQASSAWQSYQEAWDSIFGDINGILAQLGGAVGQALANAQTAEGANSSMWPSD